jgi:hypothetical protein
MAQTIFGRDPRLFTHYIRAITDHVYSQFYHKISGDSMQQWIPKIDSFRGAIWQKLMNGLVNERSSNGKNVDWQVWIPFNLFRIFGWIDDTDMQTDRPRAGRTLQNGNDISDL